jgi:predicted Zn-dependent protease
MHPIHRSPPRRMAALMALTLIAGCATNPVTGRRELTLMSESQEIEAGRQGAADVTAAFGLYRDVALQAYVNRIGQALAQSSERPKLAWEFHVIDDAAVNAFALPGGFIFVTRGLLAHMTNEAELASVLGHEAGHVTARHSVQQMSRQQLASIGLGLGSVLSPVVARYGQVAGSGLGLLFLKYGRDDETQADRLGFRYALANGYDTREMISVFQMLQQDALLAGAGRLPEWQSSHPNPDNRIGTVRQLIAESRQDFTGKTIGARDFLRRIDGMVYGDNPRLGYFEGSRFLHPDLKFSLTFPAGWTTRNASDAVTAMSGAKDAMLQLRGVQGTAAEASASFFGQQGLQVGPRSQGIIHGNRTVSAEFSATGAEGAPVRGVATFIEFGGTTWGIVGYTTADRFGAYSATFQRSIESFDRLTDPAALAVQPLHLRVETVARTMSLEQFNTQFPSSISMAELALINGMATNDAVQAGQLVKRVIGTPMARVSARP